MSFNTGTIDEQLQYLIKGAVDVVRQSELRSKQERAVSEGRPLVIKVGFDPTAPEACSQPYDRRNRRPSSRQPPDKMIPIASG